MKCDFREVRSSVRGKDGGQVYFLRIGKMRGACRRFALATPKTLSHIVIHSF
jgi:hypothetical protein